MSNEKKNYIYLLNGSIGDFLMVLFLFSSISKVESGKNTDFYISTPRYKKLLTELSVNYPNIKVVDYSPKLLKFLFSKNIVFTPPIIGKLPWHQKLTGWLLSRMPGGKLVGFDEGSRMSRYLYKKTVTFTQEILYIESLFDLLEKNNISFKKEKIFINFPQEKAQLASDQPYIVLHPFGSSAGRSLLGEKLKEVIYIIEKYFPNHIIYITGSDKDSENLRELIFDKVTDVTGKLSMKELCGLINGSDLYIGVDTGITHIANTMGVKTLVIAEQGTPHWLPYYNENARIVYKIKEDKSAVFEGREYLESKRLGRVRYLDRVPVVSIDKMLKIMTTK